LAGRLDDEAGEAAGVDVADCVARDAGVWLAWCDEPGEVVELECGTPPRPGIEFRPAPGEKPAPKKPEGTDRPESGWEPPAAGWIGPEGPPLPPRPRSAPPPAAELDGFEG